MSRVQQQKGGYRWYLVIAKRGRERLAKESLERKGFHVYLPMHAPEPERPRPGAPVAPQPRPFLPGYLFVSVDIATPGWREVFSTFGVQDVYCSGKGVDRVPLAIQNSWIELLQIREVNGLIVRPHKDQVRAAFAPGAAVQVPLGRQFGTLDAVFLEAVDAKRSLILVSLLGRDSRQEVATSILKARAS